MDVKRIRVTLELDLDNNLLELIAEDSSIPFTLNDLKVLCNPHTFTGRAAGQVEDYLKSGVEPLLEANRACLEGESEDQRV